MITDSILGTQSFTYDHLNRVTGAAFNGGKGNFAMAWTYDTYGNRKSESVSGTSTLTFTQPSPSSFLGASIQNGTPLTGAHNNRVDGQNYDKSGNFLGSQLTPAFTYDAESRIETAGGVCYLYNAEGLRTAKGTWSEGECLNITAEYVLGPGDAQLAEFDGAGNWKHTNVFGGGKLLATYDALGTHFHLNDWLGTARLQVGVSGAIDETCISLPFGDGLTCSGPVSEATEHHFTGKEHDAETGLDYFGARYFQDTSGRWMSPDWAAKAEPIPYAKMDNPQSLDLYAYVDNNPLSVADPDGHDPAPATCDLYSAGCAGTDTGAKEKEQAKETVKSHARAAQQHGTPAALVVKDVTVLDTKGQNGINVAVTYQIVDSSGKPVHGKNMIPMEHVDEKQKQSGTPIPLGYDGFGPIGPTSVPGTSRNAAKDGTFTDAPVGTTFAGPGGAVVATQQIQIDVGNKSYLVRTNVFNITSGSGSGTISNGSDINAHTP